MRKPPHVDQGPTWGAGAVIAGTPYVVVGKLDRGGMGAVYEVRHVDVVAFEGPGRVEGFWLEGATLYVVTLQDGALTARRKGEGVVYRVAE